MFSDLVTPVTDASSQVTVVDVTKEGVIAGPAGSVDTGLIDPQQIDAAPIEAVPADRATVDTRRIETALDAVPPANGLDACELTERSIKDLVQVLKLLADDTRLRIVFGLSRHGELHVRALCDLLGQSQPAVSHHLGLLRVAGIVDCRRAGKHHYYRLLSDHFHKLLGLMREQLPAAPATAWLERSVLAIAPG